jgi:hypothetical protein
MAMASPFAIAIADNKFEIDLRYIRGRIMVKLYYMFNVM